MSERPGSEIGQPPETESSESPERKRERLTAVFSRSQEVFRDSERPLSEGALVVTMEAAGERKAVGGLVVLEMDDQAVEFGAIEEDGEIGASGFVEWEKIIDANPE